MENKRIPYAIHDFKRIRDKNFLYIDKTRYIEALEGIEDYVLFLRPRRFGKTLFTSVLTYYYDVNYQNDFDMLFGGLYIGGNKTDSANSYNVLKFDFSGIETSRTKIKRQFADCLRAYLKEFAGLHKLNIKLDTDTDESNTILRNFLSDYKLMTDIKIFVIIDEYDHFANDMLSEDKDYFNEITGKDGFIRKFYEVFKSYAGNTIERMFITGVTPIAIDALTSGFNIVSNIGNDESLNEMIGFTENEVKMLLTQNDIDEKNMEVLRENYNGYLFNVNAKNKVYNSNLLMYFLKEYKKVNGIPENLVDINVISDQKKIGNLFNLYEDAEDKRNIIIDIINEQVILSVVEERMSDFTKIDKNGEKVFSFSRKNFISLLYYLGLLTIYGGNGEIKCLKVPNQCIRTVYFRYYLDYLSSISSVTIRDDLLIMAIMNIVNKNNFTDFNKMVEEILRNLSNVDYQRFDEKYVKVVMFSLLSLSSLYTLKSEYEIEGKRADLMILPNHKDHLNYYFLIEIKYLKKDGTTNADIECKRIEAVEQARLYSEKEEMKRISNLRKYAMVVVKDEIKVFEEVW